MSGTSTQSRFESEVREWQAPNVGHAMYETWVQYALSTNERGRDAARTMAGHRALAGARTLDVGCAYAGYPVAFAEAGARAVGIEIDANLLRLARANVADQPTDVELHHGSVLDTDLMRSLGRFDVITCGDVIEHVPDVPLALRNMAECLAPGGVLYLQIPNAFATSLVCADGHFGLFGITLLPRAIAEAYFHEAGYGGPYDVHHYYPLEAYLQYLAPFGIREVEAGGGAAPADDPLASIRAGLDAVADGLPSFQAREDLSGRTRVWVARAVEAYTCGVRDAVADCESRWGRSRREALAHLLFRRFQIGCWDLIVRRE